MEIKILYGSETGNSEGLAKCAQKDLKNDGYKSEIIDMADIKISDLETYDTVFIITSTWGDGEPPSNAQKLYDELKNETETKLKNLKFCVFAIGMSSFDNFCKAGEDFDEMLEKLGASRVKK